MPLIADIISSLQNPLFRSEELGDFVLVTDKHGVAHSYVSSGAVVFKVLGSEGKYRALKCYLKPKPDLDKRYELLRRHFSDSKYRFEFIKDALRVVDFNELKSLDVLISDWIEGRTLMDEIRVLCDMGRSKELHWLTVRLADMLSQLLASDFAHGDIKPANIIISPDNQFSIIDWDGMYHPLLAGSKPFDFGTVAYNHPSRSVDDYGEGIDCYAVAMIIVSICALSYQPAFYKYYSDSERILFSPSEIINGESILYDELKQDWSFNTAFYKIMKLLQTKDINRFELSDLLRRIAGEVDYDESKLQFIDDDCGEELRRVVDRKSGLYGLVNRLGKVTVDTIWGDLSYFNEGYAAARLGTNYFLIDRDGFTYHIDCQLIRAVHGGMAAVKIGFKWGFWNVAESRLAVECEYDSVSDFMSNGTASVERDGLCEFITKDGEKVI